MDGCLLLVQQISSVHTVQGVTNSTGWGLIPVHDGAWEVGVLQDDSLGWYQFVLGRIH